LVFGCGSFFAAAVVAVGLPSGVVEVGDLGCDVFEVGLCGVAGELVLLLGVEGVDVVPD
jgi:hypothetical protein